MAFAHVFLVCCVGQGEGLSRCVVADLRARTWRPYSLVRCSAQARSDVTRLFRPATTRGAAYLRRSSARARGAPRRALVPVGSGRRAAGGRQRQRQRRSQRSDCGGLHGGSVRHHQGRCKPPRPSRCGRGRNDRAAEEGARRQLTADGTGAGAGAGGARGSQDRGKFPAAGARRETAARGRREAPERGKRTAGNMELPGMQLPVVTPYRVGDDFDKWVRGIERYLSAVDIKDIDRKCAVL